MTTHKTLSVTSTKPKKLALAVAVLMLSGLAPTQADTVSEFLTGGTVYGNANLRYEAVEQDNALDDASAFTLRTRLGYKTGVTNGFSAVVEFEDSRIVLGQGDYSVPPTGYQPGEYSVIADPETTELDQAFLQYKADGLTVKLGRQVIAIDNHRFVGHVGWRQDRQTFDAATLIYAPNDKFNVQYNYLTQRNRIFAQAADLDSKDHLLTASYKTPLGKLSAYSYMLEVDNDTDNSLDTFGVSLAGGKPVGDNKIVYRVEYASQTNETATTEYDTDYMLLEGGYVFSGITAKLGYEVLGSDDGMAGFSTPLATLHKFNGFTDQFLGTPATGLVDTYAMVKAKALGGNWTVKYHMFEADESTDTVDDYGSEFNLVYVKPVSKKTKLGVKYASYSADDFKVDSDKVVVWANVSF